MTKALPDHPPRNAGELRHVLEAAGLRLRKNLGQNFLVDRNLRDALVRDAGVGPDDVILEVGVGLGILTEGLLDSGARVIGVELDEGMLELSSQLLAPHLVDDAAGEAALVPGDQGPHRRLRLIRANVLEKKDLAEPVTVALEAARAADSRLLLVANLPYNIASTVLIAALEWRSKVSGRGIDGFSVLVQLEVARRLVADASTPDYGGLTVYCRAHADVKLARRVPGSVFQPQPKVDSGFVTGVVREASSPAPLGMSAERYSLFRDVVHAAFQYRRKRLARALEYGLQRPAADIRAAIAAANLPEDVRGEALTPAQFAALSDALAAGNTHA